MSNTYQFHPSSRRKAVTFSSLANTVLRARLRENCIVGSGCERGEQVHAARKNRTNPMCDLTLSSDFRSAAHATMRFLRDRFGISSWVVARAEGDNSAMLAAQDHAYGVRKGVVLPWKHSFCFRMRQGQAPRITPDFDAVAACLGAPTRQHMKIRGYIGLPLKRNDGSLFGTLCAIDPLPRSESEALLTLLADLLGTVLSAELRTAEAMRRAEKAEAELMRDPLTLLYNRRGWDLLTEKEEERCRRHGRPACVISIDLDNLKIVNDSLGHAAGDELIVHASRALVNATRSTDIVARLGGDEFAVLGVECDANSAGDLVNRLRKQFAEYGVKASVGMAMRSPLQGIRHAYEEADAQMYREKQNRPVLA